MKVLSLFDGISCGMVALERAGFSVENYDAFEIDSYAIKVSKKNYPNIVHHGDVFNGDYTQFKGYDLLIGGSPCFTKGHYVLTDTGYKDISEVQVGDKVLTHKGNYKSVVRTYTRMAETKKVNIMGFTNFVTTGNHPFYSIQRSNATNKEYLATHSRRKFSIEPNWTKVDDMTTDTFCGKHTYIPEQDFEIDDELLWILGRYIADGHLKIEKRKDRENSYHYQVVISVGSKKLEDFKKHVQSRHFSCYEHSQNVYRCVFSSKEMCSLIEKYNFGRNAYTKTIPESFMRLPVEKSKILLDGYLSGDGSYIKESDSYACSTVSPTLALQIQRLVAHVYKTNAGISISSNDRKHMIDGREIHSNYPLYTLCFKKEKRKQSVWHIQNDIIWTPVKTVTPTNKTEQVYNIEVEDDNSYTINNCIVHNCTYWSIARGNRETTPDGIGGQLFMQYVRALKESECKYFLYENNFSIHKDIKSFISEQLGVQPIMINSALVSGQSRKRCYWTNIPNVTQPKNKNILLADILENSTDVPFNTIKGKSHTITATYGKAGYNPFSPYGAEAGKQRIAIPIEAENNIAESVIDTTKNPIEMKSESEIKKLESTKKENTPIRVGQIGKGGQGQRIYSVRGKSVTLSANGGGQGAKTGLYKIDLPDGDYLIRKLTPIEAERLQTLPDDYTSGISNTQRYKCIGNGWTIDVIAHILSNIKELVE